MSSGAQVYLKIGDVARLVGISPSAIRGWEALGLTHPQRTESRYRLYTNDDVRLLKKARYLRKVRGLNAAAIVQTLKREGVIKPAAGNGAASIGPRLRRLRAKRGVNLAEVAAAAGISIGFLSAIERSQMSASVGTLRRLARYYRTNAKCSKPVPASAWSCSPGATKSWNPTCFASRPKPAVASPTPTKARSSSSSCAAN